VKGQGSRASKRVDSNLPYNIYKGFGFHPPSRPLSLPPKFVNDINVTRK
jgi:hypothetical protein